MRAQKAEAIRFGILKARDRLCPERLTAGQSEFLDTRQEWMVGDWGTTDAHDREYEKQYATHTRRTNYLPGDLVRITLATNDICNDSHNGKGVVIYGPDDSYETGWIVSSVPGGLRCVGRELTMITPREDR